MDSLTQQQVANETRCWVEQMVIGQNLCPFARKPYEAGQVRFIVSSAKDEESLLVDFQQEVDLLQQSDIKDIETTVLIHPYVLQDFIQYNNFLDVIDHYLELAGLQGIYQVASLHPDYQFADVAADDISNYTNRSPYPVLHILREESVARAIESYVRPDKIPERNIRKLNELGLDMIVEILQGCKRN